MWVGRIRKAKGCSLKCIPPVIYKLSLKGKKRSLKKNERKG
jgi:hypothetical protein